MCGTALNRGEYITCGECDENFYRDVEKEKEKEKKETFIVHLWMYAARHRGRDGNPSEARSHAGEETCGCCQTFDPIRV